MERGGGIISDFIVSSNVICQRAPTLNDNHYLSYLNHLKLYISQKIFYESLAIN